MYGLFDLYHIPWSRIFQDQYMRVCNLQYSVQPIARQKGCFEQIIKYARNTLIKELNRWGKNYHGYTLLITGAEKGKSRPNGIFLPYMLKKHKDAIVKDRHLCPLTIVQTTQGELRDNEKIVQTKYNKGNFETSQTHSTHHGNDIYGKPQKKIHSIASGCLANCNTA